MPTKFKRFTIEMLLEMSKGQYDPIEFSNRFFFMRFRHLPLDSLYHTQNKGYQKQKRNPHLNLALFNFNQFA